MKRHPLIATAAVAMLLTGCDKIPFIGGSSEAATDSAAADSSRQAGPTTVDSVQTPAPAVSVLDTPQQAATEPAPPPPPRPEPRQVATSNVGEVPYSPGPSGTVNPGMTRDDVLGQWGTPATEREMGDWTYLYFRNGCERRCGTFDIVFLQGGQVVDAVVRAPNHAYSGVSSSPPNSEALFSPPQSTVPDTLGTIG